MATLRAGVLAAVLCCTLAPVLPGLAQAQAQDFVLALTGDSIITRRLSVYSEPAFTRIIELIRGADAAFTNLEMLFHDFEPYASAASGGTYMRAEPALVKDLVASGFGAYQEVLAVHAEGSLEAEKLMVLRSYDGRPAVQFVRRLAGLE